MLCMVGHICVDDIAYADGHRRTGNIGGAALYAAVGARVWVRRVRLAARLSSDYPVERLESLSRLGVETCLHPVAVPSLKNQIDYAPDGARTYRLKDGSGTHDEVSIRPGELSQHAMASTAFHIAPMPTHRQCDIVQSLRRHDALVSLDPHLDYIGGTMDLLDGMLSRAKLLLPSREEAAAMSGRDDPWGAVEEFAARGAEVTAIKMGGDGSIVYDASSGVMAHVPALPVEAVDPTGAGDAYCGGFLAAYLLYGDALLAAACGTVSASYVLQHFGALAPLEAGFVGATGRLREVKRRARPINRGHSSWI